MADKKVENLRPLNTIPEEEAKEIRRKGQRAQQEKKRERKRLEEIVKIMLSLKLKTDGEAVDIEQLRSLPELAKSNMTVMEASILAQIKLSLEGNGQAFDRLMSVAGETKPQEININGKIPVVISGEDELED